MVAGVGEKAAASQGIAARRHRRAKGRERDMLVASARADLRGGDAPTFLPALMETWLDAMLAGADQEWTDEAHERAEELLATARRCKPNAGYGALRAIIVFESTECGGAYTPAFANYGQPVSTRPHRRRISDAVDSLMAMAES